MQTSSETTRRERPITYGLVALISGLYIYICAHTPLSILADAHFDDGLFMSHGRLLAAGHWLGPFSQFTLMKGPGYPAFLALSAWSRLPITITEAIFNCIAVGGISWIIWCLSRSRLLALATFVLVLWNPGLVQQRVIREAIYPAQLLIFLAALSYAFFCTSRRVQVVLWGSLAGAMLGWFWLTREEGAWILPGATLLILGGVLNSWLRTHAARLPVTAAACMLLVFTLIIVAFRLVNLLVYGSFVGVDVKESNFAGALDALQSVEVGKPIPFVPVTAQARLKIYQVSPAFAAIGTHLDSPEASPWRDPGCAVYPWTCNDIAGGWFMWALRDAAAAEGFYQSPARASRFFGKVRTQIDSACRDGRLVCSSSPIPFMPRISEEQAWQIPGREVEGLSYLLFRKPSTIVTGPSGGTPTDLNEALRFLNFPTHMPLPDPSLYELQKRAVVTQLGVSLAIELRELFIRFYGRLMPVLFWAGLLALPVAIWLMGGRRAASDPILVLAVVSWVLILSRITLLALIDVSSFPAIGPGYLAPIYALTCIAPMLSIASIIGLLRRV